MSAFALTPRATRMATAWAVALALGLAAFLIAAAAPRRLPRPQPLEELSYYPSGRCLEPATLGLDSLQATFGIDILSVDRVNKELEVGLSIETPDPKLGRQTKTATFSVSYFDFPMIDNTRLTGGDRCAIVLNGFSDYAADITVVLFPGAYASLKEKPYYSEVIESVRRENERMGK